MQVEPLVAKQPALHRGRLVRREVVEDDVDGESFGTSRLIVFKKATKSFRVCRRRISVIIVPLATSSAANRPTVP